VRHAVSDNQLNNGWHPTQEAEQHHLHPKRMKQEPEYASQYSTRERWRHVLIGIPAAAVILAVCKWWAFPELRMFAQTAHCRTVLGIPGTSVLMYGVFVGLPLAASISIAAFEAPLAIRSIRMREYPPPGVKVHGKVRVRNGQSARLAAIRDLLAPTALGCIAVWGGFQASELARSLKPPSSYPECKAYLEEMALGAEITRH